MTDTELDLIIRSAAEEFAAFVGASRWQGREREAISLFAFGVLLRRCTPETILFDPTQIAIEACVPGVAELNPKKRVNKDLVIWRTPGMTLWREDFDARREPMSVIEWKVFRLDTTAPLLSRYDLNWLTRFSADRPEFTGYAVSLALAQETPRLAVARVQKGQADESWLIR